MAVALVKQSIDLGIVTANGEAMLRFYRDVLGFRYLRELPMPGIGAGVVMHQMLCGDSMIKLVVAPSLPAKAVPGTIAAASGYRYWTITVSNLDEMVATCAAAGITVALPRTELRPGVSVAIVLDPDGNLVEFLALG
jgi:catechol 2,3-dioxygenase-like lactoylglutathione lyase family enzyme